MNPQEIKRAERIRKRELKLYHPENSIYRGLNIKEEKRDKEFNYKAYQMMTSK